jgi:hypothetical protein
VLRFGDNAAAEDGPLEHEIEDRHGEQRVGEFKHLLHEALVTILDGACLVGVSLGLHRDAFKEEGAPTGPTAGLADLAEGLGLVEAAGERDLEADLGGVGAIQASGTWDQTSEQLGYGDPSNGEFKSLAVVLCFPCCLLFSPQKATKRTKKKGIGSARLEGPFGHFF